MQWPAEPVDPDRVAGWVHDALRPAGDVAAAPDPQTFLLRLLPTVMDAHPSVNPYRYDLPPAAVAEHFPDVPRPDGPTAEPIVEMAPFVPPKAWEQATPAQAAATPVIATTPRNAFRLPLLATIFPNARLRVIHLTRNPAAAINGLRAGWLHHGFFSAPAEIPLRIRDYGDAFAWGSRWWNYDVPPDWREWSSRPLAQVCAHQWRSAHTSTLDTAATMRLETHRVAFEDIVGGPDRRALALRRLCQWLDIDPVPLLSDGPVPVVMPTAPPRPRRWADNAGLLNPVLTDPLIVSLAQELGYPGDPSGWE
jgi:hypothetical protein